MQDEIRQIIAEIGAVVVTVIGRCGGAAYTTVCLPDGSSCNVRNEDLCTWVDGTVSVAEECLG